MAETSMEIQEELIQQARRLYDQFGRTLEADHLGKFVAISPDGRTLLGDSAGEVGRKAKQTFGPGNFVFKIGPRIIGRWRKQNSSTCISPICR